MSHEELRRIIADVARHSPDRSIATTRAELAARLTEAGIGIPSESWLDALAREAVHGRSYVLDTEDSDIEERDDPALGQALEEAPATLSTAETSSEPPDLPGRAGVESDAGPPGQTPVGPQRPGQPPGWSRWALVGLTACSVLVLWWRRKRIASSRGSEPPG